MFIYVCVSICVSECLKQRRCKKYHLGNAAKHNTYIAPSICALISVFTYLSGCMCVYECESDRMRSRGKKYHSGNAAKQNTHTTLRLLYVHESAFAGQPRLCMYETSWVRGAFYEAGVRNELGFSFVSRRQVATAFPLLVGCETDERCWGLHSCLPYHPFPSLSCMLTLFPPHRRP